MSKSTFLDRTYVVVVNWKLPSDTIECVRSLLSAGALPGHILVVDNGSGDDSIMRLRAELGERIQLLESETNLGFAGGNNWAIEQALLLGAEWVLLANNDTVVASTFFAQLEFAVQNHPDFALISPLILYHDTSEIEKGLSPMIWSLGNKRLLGTLITRDRFRNQPVPDQLPDFVAVDFLNACGLLVHQDVFQQIGAFDRSYFMYTEDVDFCWRANLAGFKLGCATRARMWHKVTRSTGIHHPAYRYWTVANQIRFYRRYATAWQLPLMFCFTILQSGMTMIGDVVYGRTKIARTVMQAWLDGWFRKRV